MSCIINSNSYVTNGYLIRLWFNLKYQCLTTDFSRHRTGLKNDYLILSLLTINIVLYSYIFNSILTWKVLLMVSSGTNTPKNTKKKKKWEPFKVL